MGNEKQYKAIYISFGLLQTSKSIISAYKFDKENGREEMKGNIGEVKMNNRKEEK